MNSKTSKVILIAFTLFTFLAVRTNCIALPVDLGTAGLGYWTVLEVGSGTVTQSQSGAVMGNVGVAQNGDISASGPQLNGDLYLGDTASAQFSGTYVNNRPVTGEVHLGTGATIASNSYSFTNVSDTPQRMLDQARLDAIGASAAAAGLSPTSTLSQINLKRKTLTLAPGTYNLTSFRLTRATLTLSGSGSFVFNISSAFALKSAQVLLAGGATEANVLFNYTGTSDVTLSGKKGSTSVLHGIILALNAKVNLAAGLVVGEIISGNDISTAGTITHDAGAAPAALVPEGTSTFALSLIALCSLAAFRSFLVHRSSRRTEPCR